MGGILIDLRVGGRLILRRRWRTLDLRAACARCATRGHSPGVEGPAKAAWARPGTTGRSGSLLGVVLALVRPLATRSLADLRRAGADRDRAQLRGQADRQAAAAGAGGAAAARRRAQLAQLPLRPRDLLVRGGDGDDPGRPARRRSPSSSPSPSRSAVPTSACTTRPTSSPAPLLGVALGLIVPPLAMKVGIVGLPNAGKSTLFNALTKGGAQTGDYPFTTIEPNVAIAQVPDERLEQVGGDGAQLRAGAGDDLLPRHRRPGQGRLRGGGPRQPVPRLDPRDRRDLPRRPLPRRLRRPPPRRPRRPARRHRDDRDRADALRLRAGRAPPRPGRARGRSRATPRRSPSATGWSRWSRRSPRASRPARCRSPTPPPTARANLQALTSKPILYVANVDEGDAEPPAGGRRPRRRGRRRRGRGQRPDRGRAGRARPGRSGGDARVLRGRGLRPGPPGPRRLRPARADHLLHRRRGQGGGRPAAAPRRHRLGGGGRRSTPRSRTPSSKPRRSAGRSWSSAAATPPARDRGLLRIEGRDYVVHDGDVITIKV